MLSIFSREKSFDDRWVGSSGLNALGLHIFRVKLARLCNTIRYQQTGLKDNNEIKKLRNSGYIKVSDFLPQKTFEAILTEAEESIQKSEAVTPVRARQKTGFGEKQQHSWGFDRFDGGTLNRFVNIDPATMPNIDRFCHEQRLTNYTKAITGRPHKPGAIWIYLTVHGDETINKDDQKSLHRDTFFSSMKFWYFLHPVSMSQGPFAYVTESHKLGSRRAEWESKQAKNAVQAIRGQRESSFRIDSEGLAKLGLAEPTLHTVPANTLIIADTFGFHKRGQAEIGARRLALYGNLRPHPYALTVK